MLCGLSTNSNNCYENIIECYAPVDPSILPDAINKFLISVIEHVSLIDVSLIDVDALNDFRRRLT
jgi:hypothetical protein